MPSRGPFDPDYMSALFQLGENLGKSATPFGNAPPPYPGPPALPVPDPAKNRSKLMRKLGGVVTAAAVAAALVATIPFAARAANIYDGAWTVTIFTQAGNCPSSLRYGVRVVGRPRVRRRSKLPGQRDRGGERRDPRDGFRTRPIRQRHRPIVRQRGGGTLAHQHRPMRRPVDCGAPHLLTLTAHPYWL